MGLNYASYFANLDKTDVYTIVATALLTAIVVKLRRNISHWNFDHFWQNLDKMILLFLFIICLAVAIHLMHHGNDGNMISWIENTSGQVLSALLAVLGARSLTRKGDGNGNGNGNGNGYATTAVDSVTGGKVDGTTTLTPQP